MQVLFIANELRLEIPIENYITTMLSYLVLASLLVMFGLVIIHTAQYQVMQILITNHLPGYSGYNEYKDVPKYIGHYNHTTRI